MSRMPTARLSIGDTNGTSQTSEKLSLPNNPLIQGRLTLKKLWEEADERFFNETGYHLQTSAPMHKEGVLQKWQARYNGEKSSMQDKMDRLSPILQNIVNGVEIVGGFAASAASAVFGPAQMCFNAITFVLDAPGKIKQVYDSLEALFKEVAQFLVRFKVLDRIDEKGRLDVELLENANKLLVSFTHICAIAAKLLRKKRNVITALEAVFLMNDGGVQDALAEFKGLANNQAQTVGVISLEHILQNEHLSHEILLKQSEVNMYIQTVSTRENDEKTRKVNEQKIAEIETKLFSRFELEQLDQMQQMDDVLPETLKALTDIREYKTWSSEESLGTSELNLSGGSGTGKTQLMNALRAHLGEQRRTRPKHSSSLYVAYHSFANQSLTTTLSDRVAQALKNIARQVAAQSTRYASELLTELRDRNLTVENDYKKLWSILKLFKFGPPPNSVMYLLIDGLSGEDGSKTRQTIRNLTIDAKTVDDSGNRFKVCILMAGAPEVMEDRGVLTSRVVQMRNVNEGLLEIVIDREFRMQNIFTDTDQRTVNLRAEFAKAVLQRSEGDFHTARQKIKRMREALDDDATRSELEAIIEEDELQTVDEEARVALNNLVDELSPRQLNQLKKILMWMLYGMPGLRWTILLLQAVLRLDQKEETLESLTKKIDKRFNKVIHTILDGRAVRFMPGVKEYLKRIDNADSAEIEQSSRLISMTINIQNAKKTEVQRFILDLNAQLASDASLFEGFQTKPREHGVRILEVESLVEIVLLSLTALNEDISDDALLAFSYAFTWLPRTLTDLLRLRSQIQPADLQRIQAELIMFLSEPFFVERRQNLDLECLMPLKDAWFGNYSLASSLSECLDECVEDLDSQRHLQARQRRWLKAAASRYPRTDYLKELARSIAGRWRTACLEEWYKQIRPCYEWLSGYLENRKPHKWRSEDSGSVRSFASQDTASDSETTATAPQNDRVLRLYEVGRWILGESEEDPTHFYCIGTSLYEMDEWNEAVINFEKARADPDLAWRATINIGHIKKRQDQVEEAVALYEQGVSSARELSRNGHIFKKLETKLIIDTLGDLGRILIKDLKRVKDGLPYLQELLEKSPGDGPSRWFLFEELCKLERYEEANELLEAWIQHPEDCDDQDPSAAFCEMAKMGDAIWPIFLSARQQKVRDKLMEVLQQAVDDAASRSKHVEQMWMLYDLAMVYAHGSSNQHKHKAIRCLEDLLELAQGETYISHKLHNLIVGAIRFASRLKFDVMREETGDDVVPFQSSPRTIRDDLDRYITRVTAVSSRGVPFNPYWYVASICIILKQPRLSRDMLKPNVTFGIDILSDDEPENDSDGVEALIMAFSCYGNEIDARIAFSLLDRGIRKNLLLGPKENNDALVDDEGIEGRCVICQDDLKSITGFWRCRWCPNREFCALCLEQFRTGKKWQEHCHRDHEFIYYYHPECDKEELETGKVMVDWEVEHTENGKFKRKGGRLVDVAEWLERLRVEWDISAPDEDTGRAQA